MNGTTTLQQQKFLIIPWVSTYKTVNKKKVIWDKSVQILRDEIGNAWQGSNSVEEIRNQRSKSY
ncbi:MAG: hypothetical protein ABIA91_01295 [Patescibacteria group bacterium]